MARSSRSKRQSARRDTIDIANQRLPRQLTKFNYEPSSTRFRKLRSLTNAEDRRTYHPDNISRFPRKVYGQSSKIITRPIQYAPPSTVGKVARTPKKTFTLGFGTQKEVATCVRRKTRKEVIHALRHAGKGSQRAPRYNWRSKVRCK